MLKDYYDSKIYERVGNARKKAVLSLIPESTQKRTLLDVGCSNGEFGALLKRKRGMAVYGVDVSKDAIASAAQVLDGACVADLESEDFSKLENYIQIYEYILVSEVLEHLFFPERLLHSLRKYSNGGTRIIITVPNILFWKNRAKIFFGNFDYTASGLMDRGHIHFFSYRSFMYMLAEAGLEVEEAAHNIPTRGTKWLGKIFPGLFAFQFIVRARWRAESARKHSV